MGPREGSALVSRHLTPEVVQAALQQAGDQVPSITPRMHRYDLNGNMLPEVMGPPPGKAAMDAAVLVLLYCREGELTVALTRRTDHLDHHAGQISLPGGGVEATDASYLHTALRETQEELGVDAAGAALWATLKSVYVPPSNYLIHPFVMYHGGRPQFRPDPWEVAEVLELPLPALLRQEALEAELREHQGQLFWMRYFRFKSHKIWGATARVLDQLFLRIETGLAAMGS